MRLVVLDTAHLGANSFHSQPTPGDQRRNNICWYTHRCCGRFLSQIDSLGRVEAKVCEGNPSPRSTSCRNTWKVARPWRVHVSDYIRRSHRGAELSLIRIIRVPSPLGGCFRQSGNYGGPDSSTTVMLLRTAALVGPLPRISDIPTDNSTHKINPECTHCMRGASKA